MKKREKYKKFSRPGTILALFLAALCSMVMAHSSIEVFANSDTNSDTNQQIEKETSGEEINLKEAETGLVFQEGFYVLYIDGVLVTEEGWKACSDEKYYVGSQGTVTEKISMAGDKWKYYIYETSAAKWNIQKDVWKDVEGIKCYFSSYGNCVQTYEPDTGLCRKYSNGKMVSVKNECCVLDDGKMYYFNSRGFQDSQEGWKKISSQEYVEVGKQGYVVSRIKKSGALWQYSKYHYGKSKWEKQKDVWVSVDGKEYYFSSHGNGVKIYVPRTRKGKIYQKGKMVLLNNETTTLSDGKFYYFNGKGVRVEKKGWRKVSGRCMVQIGKQGYVTEKLQKNTKGVWKYLKQNHRTGKWEKQKNVWKTVGKKKYYFSKWGNCVHIYHSGTRKYYDLKKGNMTLAKSAVREIKGKKYYFGANGVMVKSAGLYLTASGRLICTAASGRVTKEISGQVLEYTSQGGKITSCRVQDANHMCYYNGNGSLRRQIDLNAAMVALTYDDGPSQYTSQILDVLRQYGGTATFFVLGQRVSAYSDTIRSCYGMGCEIGNHTFSHQTLTKAGVSAIQSQISGTNTAVQNIIGVSPVVMRPPGGAHNETVRGSVGMPVILWSIDTLDWKTRNAASTQAAVLNHVKDGDIILMHDLYSQTAEASRVIIPELVRRGYQLVTVSELADCRGGMTKGGVYQAFRK